MILNISLDYNPETKKCKVLKVETDEVPTKVPEEFQEPQIILGPSNYTLNSAAMELLKVTAESRISINYQPVGDSEFPVIGSEQAFGCGGGQKVSKSKSVIYKGRQHDRLAGFGNVFTLTPLEGVEGIFVLNGNAEKEAIPDDIEVTEDMTSHVDKPSEPDTPNHKDMPAMFEINSGAEVSDEPLTFDDDLDFSIEEEDSDKLIKEDTLSFE